MTFEYKTFVSFEKELEIDDIGNFAIEAVYNSNSTLGPHYKYLIMRTSLGMVSVFEYDSIIPDFTLLPKSVTNSYDRFDWSEYKIIKRIEKFLANVEDVKVITMQEALANCRSIIDYFGDLNNY